VLLSLVVCGSRVPFELSQAVWALAPYEAIFVERNGHTDLHVRLR